MPHERLESIGGQGLISVTQGLPGIVVYFDQQTVGAGRHGRQTHGRNQAQTAGADGLLIEVHHSPGEALCDADQALPPDRFEALMRQLRPLRAFMDRIPD